MQPMRSRELGINDIPPSQVSDQSADRLLHSLVPMPSPEFQNFYHPSALDLVPLSPFHRGHPPRLTILHVRECHMIDRNGLELFHVSPADAIGRDGFEIEEDGRGKGIDELEC